MHGKQTLFHAGLVFFAFAFNMVDCGGLLGGRLGNNVNMHAASLKKTKVLLTCNVLPMPADLPVICHNALQQACYPPNRWLHVCAVSDANQHAVCFDDCKAILRTNCSTYACQKAHKLLVACAVCSQLLPSDIQQGWQVRDRQQGQCSPEACLQLHLVMRHCARNAA